MSVSLETIVVTVPAAGTRVQVSATPIYVDSVTFYARRGNSGFMYMGDVTVTSTKYAEAISSATISRTYETQPTRLHHGRIDLSTVYIDASVSNDVCMVTYLKKKDNE